MDEKRMGELALTPLTVLFQTSPSEDIEGIVRDVDARLKALAVKEKDRQAFLAKLAFVRLNSSFPGKIRQTKAPMSDEQMGTIALSLLRDSVDGKSSDTFLELLQSLRNELDDLDLFRDSETVSLTQKIEYERFNRQFPAACNFVRAQ